MAQKLLPTLILSLGLFVACSHQDIKNKTSDWKSHMHQVASAYSNLLVFSNQGHQENQDKLIQNVKQMKTSLKKLHHKKVQMSDPIFAHNIKSLGSDLNETVIKSYSGEKDVSKTLIKNYSSRCISCHSRTPNGRNNLNFSNIEVVNSLNDYDKLDYYFALRLYDRGIQLAETLIRGPLNIKTDPFDLLVKTLFIAIRVKQDSNLAKDLIMKYLKNKNSSQSHKALVYEWYQSVRKVLDNPDLLEKFYTLDRIKNIMTKTKNPSDFRKDFLNYLLASKSIHQILDKTNSKSLNYYQALYYQGMIYESIAATSPNKVYESYYIRCIEEIPHSTLALNCYNRLKRSTTKGAYQVYSKEQKSEIDAWLDDLKRQAEEVKTNEALERFMDDLLNQKIQFEDKQGTQ